MAVKRRIQKRPEDGRKANRALLETTSARIKQQHARALEHKMQNALDFYDRLFGLIKSWNLPNLLEESIEDYCETKQKELKQDFDNNVVNPYIQASQAVNASLPNREIPGALSNLKNTFDCCCRCIDEKMEFIGESEVLECLVSRLYVHQYAYFQSMTPDVSFDSKTSLVEVGEIRVVMPDIQLAKKIFNNMMNGKSELSEKLKELNLNDGQTDNILKELYGSGNEKGYIAARYPMIKERLNELLKNISSKVVDENAVTVPLPA